MVGGGANGDEAAALARLAVVERQLPEARLHARVDHEEPVGRRVRRRRLHLHLHAVGVWKKEAYYQFNVRSTRGTAPR